MADNTAGSGEPLVVPVLREQLHVGIRRVDTGRGVRIRKTVTRREQLIDEQLLREAVEVRRVAVGRVVAPGEQPGPRQEGDTFIVPVLEEVMVIEKRLRIKEEIHIIRRAHREPFTGSTVLREEHVEVERFDETSRPK